jgi:AcrR family transcriptional regulator
MADDLRPSRRGAARKRDPRLTRAAILEAAGDQLALDGPHGLSVSRVAQRAGVNRGTAYQHFQTREQLLEATTAWVSEKLVRELFYDPKTGKPMEVDQIDPGFVVERLARFAMDNPELGRVWMFEILSSGRAARDPFWNLFKANYDKFVQSDRAKPGIDTEVHAVVTLVGVFLWPVFSRAHARTAREREQLVRRYANELLRLSMYGTMRPEKFRGLLPIR